MSVCPQKKGCLHDDSKSIDILDKLKTSNSFFENLVNAIIHSDQSGEETSLPEFFDSLDACRVR